MPVDFTQDMFPPDNAGEKHVPAVLLVDCSGSMYGAPIAELNRGMQLLQEALHEDELALGRTDLAVVSFNSEVTQIQPFMPASAYEPPVLQASGGTSLNGAINLALNMLRERKGYYRNQSGTEYYRPWLFILTDGYATDSTLTPETQNRMHQEIRNKGVFYLPMGIGEQVDIKALQAYYPPEKDKKVVLKASKVFVVI